MRRAAASDRDELVGALVRAFDADPLTNYLLRAGAGRLRAFATVFDVFFRRLSLPANEAWLAEGGRGAALWMPPGGWRTWRTWPDLHRLAGAVGLTRLPRTLAATRRAEVAHPKSPPHWYLFAIGVDPAHQGKGVGSALLHAVLETCDARGEPAYLEASSFENARLYERHGFRATEVITLRDGPTITCMWRDAPLSPRS